MQKNRIQLYHLNQDNTNEGRFLKMELDGDSGLKVSAIGTQYDPYSK
jgi:hypothetical protein